jgi:diketogulonate reductase-like aldo/keto reductase
MGEGPNDQGNSRLHIMQGCDASLKRLGVDHIDLYQIHRPQSGVPIDETLRALDDLIRAGKVRYIGTSTFAAWQLVESLWQSEKWQLNRFVCEQPPYNLLDRRIERELLPLAQTYGFGVIPWSPLAGGMLSGKYKRGKKGPKGSRYESGKFRSGEEVPEAAWDVIELAEAMSKEKGAKMDAFALAWTLANPAVTSPHHRPAHNGAVGRQSESVVGADYRRRQAAHRRSHQTGYTRRRILSGRLWATSVPMKPALSLRLVRNRVLVAALLLLPALASAHRATGQSGETPAVRQLTLVGLARQDIVWVVGAYGPPHGWRKDDAARSLFSRVRT